MELLRQLCQIHAPSGNEVQMKNFLIEYVQEQQKNWLVKPEVYHGPGFQDCLLLVFGQPKAVIFAHMDSIGFMVRYGTELIRIGGPVAKGGLKLTGVDSKGKISCVLKVEEETGDLSYEYHREIERGTELVFECDFRETETTIQSCYLDNRLGVWSALQVAQTLENGIIAFSCWEETGGGSVAYLAKHIHATYGITQALVSDITWVTEGVKAGGGVAISLRDSLIPRRGYVQKIIQLAKEAEVPYQVEVESAGGSDGKDLHFSDIPWGWCFIGAPEMNVHSPDELVYKSDVYAMVKLYKALMKKL